MIWDILLISLYIIYFLVNIVAYVLAALMIGTGFFAGEGKYIGCIGVVLLLVAIVMSAGSIYFMTTR